jgi:hypothetical protein
MQSTTGEMPKPPRRGAFRALRHLDFGFVSDFGLRVSDLRWPAPHQSTRARDCRIEAVQPIRKVRGFHHIRHRCGSLSSSNCHFLPCQEPLLSLPFSRGISHRRVSIQIEVTAGHASPVTGSSAHAPGPVPNMKKVRTLAAVWHRKVPLPVRTRVRTEPHSGLVRVGVGVELGLERSADVGHSADSVSSFTEQSNWPSRLRGFQTLQPFKNHTPHKGRTASSPQTRANRHPSTDERQNR